MADAPAQPKIDHIVHVDRLASIVSDGQLWSDSVVMQRSGGTLFSSLCGNQMRTPARANLNAVSHSIG